MQQQEFRILVVGPCGAGKSTVLNILYSGNAENQKFASGYTKQYGFTHNLQIETCQAFGNGPQRLKLIDIPGTGDPDLNYDELSEQMEEQLANLRIDVILFCVQCQEMRMTIQQIGAAIEIREFIENLDFKHIYLCTTRYDEFSEKDKYDQQVQERIAGLAEKGIQIPLENVIRFDKTKQSLQPLIQKMTIANENQVFTDDPRQAFSKYDEQLAEQCKLNKELKKQYNVQQLLLQEMAKKLETLEAENQQIKAELEETKEQDRDDGVSAEASKKQSQKKPHHYGIFYYHQVHGIREKYFDRWDRVEAWYNHLNTGAKILVRRKKGPHGIYLRVAGDRKEQLKKFAKKRGYPE